jgi:TetR/AcrR family transcriptional regulator of autoinduction and epiphytic fitness
MPNPKKSKRKYNSTIRQAQARETRKQIIEAAYRLFAEYGYAGATIEAIAQAAGVAPETIFATFGNKRTILANLVDVTVGGDEQPIPLLERPGPQAVLQEHDPARQLHLFAEDIAGILTRVAPIFEIMRVAAKTEPDIAELLKNLLEERLRNLTAVVQSLSAHGPLREGLDKAQAAEIVWTITSPEVFSLLTTDRGWSRERYIRWLGDTLARLLLP